MNQPRTSLPLVLGALLSVYVFWGATYLGIRVAVETIPPFFMAGSRFLVAGVLVYAYARLRGAGRPTGRQWLGAGTVGALLLVGGNGVVSWAEQLVPSGIAALLVATVPLWMILMGLLGRESARPGRLAVLGVGLGFAGIAVLMLPGSGPGRVSLAGTSALLVAALFWAYGSLHSRRARLPASPLLSNGMQMIVGGALLMLLSGACGEWSRLDPGRVSRASLAGLAYLVVFGSIIAYNAYLWLLKNADPTWVSSYAFVNPVVAVFLGWLLGGERLGGRALLAMAIIVSGVVLITLGRRRTQA